jgi:23S rRNA (guanine745-N1)-methyltransferase
VFDLSKRGVRAAAGRAKRRGLSALFAVAGIFTLPMQDGSADGIVSLFAPISEEEFLRVLRPGGILLVAGAGARHLYDLKRVLYDVPRENEPRADLPFSMPLLEKTCLAFDMSLSGEDATNLFAMTPYYYRTSAQGRERLLACSSLSCGAEMDFFVYQKPLE